MADYLVGMYSLAITIVLRIRTLAHTLAMRTSAARWAIHAFKPRKELGAAQQGRHAEIAFRSAIPLKATRIARQRTMAVAAFQVLNARVEAACSSAHKQSIPHSRRIG